MKSASTSEYGDQPAQPSDATAVIWYSSLIGSFGNFSSDQLASSGMMLTPGDGAHLLYVWSIFND